MRNILILVTLTIGLIFTSFIKNKTRLLEKELVNLNKEISSLGSNFIDANLEFEFLTSPKNISLIAKEFLDEDFSYYKKSQIKNMDEQKKDFDILKETKKINLNIPEKTTYTNIKLSKTDTELSKAAIKIDPNKVKKWAGLQVLKFIVGLPPIPAK